MSRAWMPLYVADYLADTTHLSAAEHGAYLLLIMHYWQNGGLPTDDRRLARIARMTTKEWNKARPAIAEFFSDGWLHERVEVEIGRANEVSEKARSKAEKRWKNNDTPDAAASSLHMPRACQSQSQSHTEETSVSSDAVPASRRDHSRDALISEARPALMAMGVSKGGAAAMIGRWLRDTGDDHARVLEAISRARDQCPHEPIAWITAHLKEPTRDHERHDRNNVVSALRRLGERLDAVD